jgi:hypothetical protein
VFLSAAYAELFSQTRLRRSQHAIERQAAGGEAVHIQICSLCARKNDMPSPVVPST